ncbi:MAG: hypothetical protein G01um101417_105 [Parcubacteria group bacterium Gr01-1014_17]|nr:MAG: hypothetical protein G01um101417_105 [Parcubacteria group bacterium Gr01-1014_17]
MYKFLFTLLFALLIIAPTISFAVFDDVTLTTDVVITAGGINLSVSGSSAVVESITVNSDRFFFTLRSGSSIQVTSTDKKQLTTSAPVQYITTNECGSSSSILKFSSSDSSETIITVTPQSSACGSSATSATVPSSSSSSSGGGGSTPAGLINPTPPSTVAQNIKIPVVNIPAVVVPPALPAQAVAPLVSPVFTSSKALRSGATNNDVKVLQQLLNKIGITIAVSGDGSPGYETNRFGKLTEKAVQKFQVKYGIVSSGTPDTTGYGLVGAKTRAKLLEIASVVPSIMEQAAPVPTPTPTPTPTAGAVSAVFTRTLSIGANSTDVKRLQQLLNTDPDTRIMESGVGSPGNETSYFGSLTTKAIQKFQVKYGVARSGDAGYGNLGPKTRAKLQEVFGN